MNNFHIYEEVGRGKYSVVYKVSKRFEKYFITHTFLLTFL